MAKQGSIPEVDIVIDHEAGVIREVHPPRLRNKKTHPARLATCTFGGCKPCCTAPCCAPNRDE